MPDKTGALGGGGVGHADWRAHRRAQDDEGAYAEWIREWILEVKDQAQYLRKLGEQRIRRLVDLAKPSFRLGIAKIKVGWEGHQLGVGRAVVGDSIYNGAADNATGQTGP